MWRCEVSVLTQALTQTLITVQQDFNPAAGFMGRWMHQNEAGDADSVMQLL